jgi:SsrA-binding protein
LRLLTLVYRSADPTGCDISLPESASIAYDEVMGRVVTENKKARFDYFIEDTFEAGIALVGTEVKSIRNGSINLKDSYAKIEKGQVYLVGCHISHYFAGNRFNHDPERMRKLLLKKSEIRRLAGKVNERGFTLVPLKVYFNEKGLAKILLGLGRGKAKGDKRQDIKERDVNRDLRRELRR